MIIHQRFNVLFQLQFYKIFTNVLSIFYKSFKIYQLPKISNKTPKYCQTIVLKIIIYNIYSIRDVGRLPQV